MLWVTLRDVAPSVFLPFALCKCLALTRYSTSETWVYCLILHTRQKRDDIKGKRFDLLGTQIRREWYVRRESFLLRGLCSSFILYPFSRRRFPSRTFEDSSQRAAEAAGIAGGY